MSHSLNAGQARHLKCYQETANLLTKNESKYAFRKPIAKQVDILLGNNRKIDSLIPTRSQDGEAATGKKRNLKDDIANQVNDICAYTSVYALDTNNAGLYKSVSYTATDVKEMRDGELKGFITTLVSIITPLLSSPDFMEYDVTEEDLDSLTKDVITYNDNLGDNKIIDKDSSLASSQIDALLSENGISLHKLNKLMLYFKTTDINFYKEYVKVATLDKSGIRHTGIRGIAVNSATGAPLKGVSITYQGKTNDRNKATLTGSNGAYELIKLIPGEHTFLITAPGYENQTITVKIIRAHIVMLNLTLQAQAISIDTAIA